MPRAQAPNPTGDGFFGGEPEDQIAQRIRGGTAFLFDLPLRI